MDYTLFDLTPSIADLNSDWTDEVDALTEDAGAGTWAVVSTHVNTFLVLRGLTGLPSNGGGSDWHCVGMKIHAHTFMCQNDGTPYSVAGTDPIRLRLGFKKTLAGSISPTTELALCIPSTETSYGSFNSIWGFTSLPLADMENDEFSIVIQKPTDLGDESTDDLHRSLEYAYIEAAFIDKSIDLLLGDAPADCGGIATLEWSG